MKNKIGYGKTLTISIIIAIIFITTNVIINCVAYRTYTKNFNAKIDLIIGETIKENPDTDKDTLIKINLLLGLFMIALISYLLTEKDIREIIWSIMYMIVFPLVYVVWGISLIYNLIKIYINNKKAKGSRLWTANLINYYKKQKNIGIKYKIYWIAKFTMRSQNQKY